MEEIMASSLQTDGAFLWLGLQGSGEECRHFAAGDTVVRAEQGVGWWVAPKGYAFVGKPSNLIYKCVRRGNIVERRTFAPAVVSEGSGQECCHFGAGYPVVGAEPTVGRWVAPKGYALVSKPVDLVGEVVRRRSITKRRTAAATFEPESPRQECCHLTPGDMIVGTEPAVRRWITPCGDSRLRQPDDVVDKDTR
jgi:hypothetical protein